MASYLGKFGTTDEDFKLALWEYYGSEEAVNQIFTISTLYRHFKTIELDAHTFPLNIRSDYSYRGTGAPIVVGVDAVFMRELIFCQLWNACIIYLLWNSGGKRMESIWWLAYWYSGQS